MRNKKKSDVQNLKESEIRPESLREGQEKAFEADVKRLFKRIGEFTVVLCPACECNDYNDEFEKFGFKYVTCNHCETLYMNPRPTPEIMTDYYRSSENYQYWVEKVFPASEKVRREKIHKPRLKRVLQICEEYSVEKGLLVEIGPGFGTFSELAQKAEQFSEVIAVEPTPELAAACKKRGIKVINKRVEEIKDELQGADVLVSFEVIEHLFEPAKFVDQCKQLIKKGGLLILSCPNGKGFDISLLREHSIAVDPEHVNLFNPASLTGMLRRNDFEVLEVKTPGRLDAELVRQAVMEGKYDISQNTFFKSVLVENWEKTADSFQTFLAESGLSSHMWIIAKLI